MKVIIIFLLLTISIASFGATDFIFKIQSTLFGSTVIYDLTTIPNQELGVFNSTSLFNSLELLASQTGSSFCSDNLSILPAGLTCRPGSLFNTAYLDVNFDFLIFANSTVLLTLEMKKDFIVGISEFKSIQLNGQSITSNYTSFLEILDITNVGTNTNLISKSGTLTFEVYTTGSNFSYSAFNNIIFYLTVK